MWSNQKIRSLGASSSMLLLALCGLPRNAAAAPVLIDFEAFSSTYVYPTIRASGFNFAPVSGGIGVNANGAQCFPQCAADGTTSLLVGGTGVAPATVAPVTMSSVQPAMFRLLGLDFAEANYSAATHWSAATIVMTGSLQGGGSVSQTLNLDGLNDGPGGADDFQSATLDSIWATSELSSLSFSGFDGALGNRAFQLDNISVDAQPTSGNNTVPEPASVALSLLALSLAGLAHRRANRCLRTAIAGAAPSAD